MAEAQKDGVKTAAPAAAAPAKDAPLEKVEKPNEKKYKEDIEESEKKIGAADKKLQAISATIREKNKGLAGLRSDVERAKREVNRLQRAPEKLAAEVASLKKRVAAAELMLNKKKRDNQKIKDELNSLIRTNDKDIQRAITRQIADLEYEQSSEVMSLKEEKELLKTIVQLKSMRKRAGLLKTKSTRKEEDDLRNLKSQATRKSNNLANNTQRIAAKELELEKMAATLEARRAKDLPALEKKRGKLLEEKKESQAEKKAVQDGFYELKRAFRKYSNELRTRRMKDEKAERDAWRAEKKKEQAEYEDAIAKMKPWLEQIAECDSIIAYLNSQASQFQEAAPVEKVAKVTSYTLADGTVIAAMGKMGKEDVGSNPYGRKKKKKKKKKKKLHLNRPLHHGMQIMAAFQKMKVTLPHYPSDIPESLEGAQEKRAYWDTKPRAVKKKKEAKKVAKKVAVAAPTPPAAEDKKEDAGTDASSEPTPPTPVKEELVRLAAADESAMTAEAAAQGAAEEEEQESNETEAAVDPIKVRTAQLLEAARARHASASVDKRAEELLEEARARSKENEEGASNEPAAGSDDGAEFSEWKCYDDDACIGEQAPALETLKIMQGEAVVYGDKPTIVLFWAKFLKWQVFPALKACEALHLGGKVKVVGIATDPKESAVSRHIQKGECPTTFALGYDKPVGLGKPGSAKGAFKAICEGTLQVPQMFLIDVDGKIVLRQPFSSGAPLADSGFLEQVDRHCAGQPLKQIGNSPEADEEEEDDGANEDVVEWVDPLSADVAW